jgi:predicted acylesterase/phospholipase RssA
MTRPGRRRIAVLCAALVLVLALVLGATPRARAQETPSDRPRTLSFTVSGGVSLGAYEAGALYFLTEAIKRSQGDVELRIATGASAGSANALISLLDSCRPVEDDPARSLGYETWLPVGMAQLFLPERVTATSVLSRKPLERAMARLARHFAAGLRADCDVVLGVSVTRETPTHAELNNRTSRTTLEIPRQIERFVVRIRGSGPGRPPRLENYVDPRARIAQPLLPFEAGDDDGARLRNFARLSELLYASAAFPLAFAAYPLAHCETDPSSGALASLSCEKPVRTRFIDGGVFDNSPLRLNHDVVQRALRRGENGRARWLEHAADDGGEVPDVRYSYVDPGTRAYPSLDVDDGDEDVASSARALGLRLAASFVETARRHELLLLLEESRDAAALGDRIGLTRNQLPTISSQLGAFFGFFERDFRKLDFYLGMYDGLAGVRNYLETTGASAQAAEARLAEQFPVLRRPLLGGLPAALRPFACLLSQVEPGYAGHASACGGEQDRNFRILLQVTLDRLYTACARAKQGELPSGASRPCLEAARGAARRQVPGVRKLQEERRAPLPDEQDFAYTLRLLADYGFAYHDLGLAADDAEYGAIKIRRRLLAMASALADAQPTEVDSLLILTASRAAVNQIAYEPPKNWLYASAGTAIELGASLLPFSWNESWARINLALQISSWETLATPKQLTLAFSPLVGPELQLLFLSNPTVQTMLGARVGYQASVTDGAGFSPCGTDDAYGDARHCSQLLLQGYFAAAIIERLRTQLVVETFPTKQDASFESRLRFQLTFGLQLF